MANGMPWHALGQAPVMDLGPCGHSLVKPMDIVQAGGRPMMFRCANLVAKKLPFMAHKNHAQVV